MSTQRRGFLKLVGRNFENKKLVRRRQDMVSIQKLVTFFFFLFLLLFSFFFFSPFDVNVFHACTIHPAESLPDRILLTSQ